MHHLGQTHKRRITCKRAMTKIFSGLRALHNSEGHKDVTKIYLKGKKKKKKKKGAIIFM